MKTDPIPEDMRYLYSAYKHIESLDMEETPNISKSMADNFFCVDLVGKVGYFIQNGSPEYRYAVGNKFAIYSIPEILQRFSN